MRRLTDRHYPPSTAGEGVQLTPREEEAARIVAERPGITFEELADALGVGVKRIWQIIGRLEYGGRIDRAGEPRRHLGPRRWVPASVSRPSSSDFGRVLAVLSGRPRNPQLSC